MFHLPGRYCVQHKERSREGVWALFLVILFWCGVFGHIAGLSSGVLLLMCYSSRNMETTQRLGIGNVTDHRLLRMANTYNIFISFSSIDLGAAMLAPSYSCLRKRKCDQLVSASRHSKTCSYPDTRLFKVREAFKRSYIWQLFQGSARDKSRRENPTLVGGIRDTGISRHIKVESRIPPKAVRAKNAVPVTL